MSYTPLWTSEASVEAYLQITISTATHPSTSETLDFIEEVETGMLKQRWGTQTTGSGTVMDISPTGAISKGSVAWWLQELPESESGRIAIPPFIPIVSVTSGSVFKNTASLSSAPSMELLVCKDNLPGATATDFMIVKKFNHKTGNHDGIAFYFYHDIPGAGRRRVTGSWVYGYNVDSKILREYATLKVCEKVILARLFSGQPMNVATWEGGNQGGYVNTQFEVQMAYINTRCEAIERRHFPVEIPIATVQGV